MTLDAWDIAVNFTLTAEGILSDQPGDAGGLTKYGISKAAHPELDIASLTRDDAIAIYKREYWDACKCDALPVPVAIAMFDFAVNSGASRAVGGLPPQGQLTANQQAVEFVMLRQKYLIHFAMVRPDQMEFLKGWMNRCADLTLLVNAL